MTRTLPLLLLIVLGGCDGGASSSVEPEPAEVASPETATTGTLVPRPDTELITGVVLASPQAPPLGRPDATVDLGTSDTAALVGASWRFVPVVIDEIDGHAPGADGRPSAEPARTHDISPRPEREGWDQAAWEPIAADSLQARRGTGHLSMGWYRASLELPERLGETDVRGGTVVFEIVVDDYAELWVNGESAPVLGARGGPVIAGWNAPNRIVLTRDAQPGQRFDIAVLAVNGPLSESPRNYYWVRSAHLDVYRAARPYDARASLGSIERLDPALARLVPTDARIERVATGFDFIEGPAWAPDGTLLFSDPNVNVIHRLEPEGRLSIFRSHSGYSGVDIGRYHQPGSNGLAIDAEGRVIVCEHGRRRVIRIERNGMVTPLAERWEGHRLNSPNDVIVGADGAIWFSDPPFGLPAAFDDPARELDFSGIYRIAPDGTLSLVSRELTGPNGLALSPDGQSLYASNWDNERRVVLRWPVLADGSVGPPETFVDLTSMQSDEALDGLEVDLEGNVYVSAPDGVRIYSPEARHLGTIHVAERPANMEWGDDDRRTLYLTAHTSLYRVRLGVRGSRRPSESPRTP